VSCFLVFLVFLPLPAPAPVPPSSSSPSSVPVTVHFVSSPCSCFCFSSSSLLLTFSTANIQPLLRKVFAFSEEDRISTTDLLQELKDIYEEYYNDLVITFSFVSAPEGFLDTSPHSFELDNKTYKSLGKLKRKTKTFVAVVVVVPVLPVLLVAHVFFS
jgi:hypothetical protein